MTKRSFLNLKQQQAAFILALAVGKHIFAQGIEVDYLDTGDVLDSESGVFFRFFDNAHVMFVLAGTRHSHIEFVVCVTYLT